MKPLSCLVVCVIIISNSAQAQINIINDYVVISTAGVSETTPYTDALDAANWEPYRLQNQRVQYSFDNGFTIELKSATELVNLGYSLNLGDYRAQNESGYVYPVLKLFGNNYVGMEMTVNSTSTKH